MKATHTQHERKHNSLWHVNNPLKIEMRLYSCDKNSSDMAAVGWLEIKAPSIPKFQTYTAFNIMLSGKIFEPLTGCLAELCGSVVSTGL